MTSHGLLKEAVFHAIVTGTGCQAIAATQEVRDNACGIAIAFAHEYPDHAIATADFLDTVMSDVGTTALSEPVVAAVLQFAGSRADTNPHFAVLDKSARRRLTHSRVVPSDVTVSEVHRRLAVAMQAREEEVARIRSSKQQNQFHAVSMGPLLLDVDLTMRLNDGLFRHPSLKQTRIEKGQKNLERRRSSAVPPPSRAPIRDMLHQRPLDPVPESCLQLAIRRLHSVVLSDGAQTPSDDVKAAVAFLVKLMCDGYASRLRMLKVEFLREITLAYQRLFEGLAQSDYLNVRLRCFDLLLNLAVNLQLIDRGYCFDGSQEALQRELDLLTTNVLFFLSVTWGPSDLHDGTTVAALKCAATVLTPASFLALPAEVHFMFFASSPCADLLASVAPNLHTRVALGLRAKVFSEGGNDRGIQSLFQLSTPIMIDAFLMSPNIASCNAMFDVLFDIAMREACSLCHQAHVVTPPASAALLRALNCLHSARVPWFLKCRGSSLLLVTAGDAEWITAMIDGVQADEPRDVVHILLLGVQDVVRLIRGTFQLPEPLNRVGVSGPKGDALRTFLTRKDAEQIVTLLRNPEEAVKRHGVVTIVELVRWCTGLEQQPAASSHHLVVVDDVLLAVLAKASQPRLRTSFCRILVLSFPLLWRLVAGRDVLLRACQAFTNQASPRDVIIVARAFLHSACVVHGTASSEAAMAPEAARCDDDVCQLLMTGRAQLARTCSDPTGQRLMWLLYWRLRETSTEESSHANQSLRGVLTSWLSLCSASQPPARAATTKGLKAELQPWRRVMDDPAAEVALVGACCIRKRLSAAAAQHDDHQHVNDYHAALALWDNLDDGIGSE